MILEANGVSFGYNGRKILKDVRFGVDHGELLAILGPNGVGKTTLLRCVNAILKPTGGAILVENRDVMKLDVSEIARLIGYVAQRQDAGRLTAFDAILMGRRPHIRWKVSDKDLRIVDAAMKRLNLQHLAMRYIDQMSGGELQKVAIARSLVQEPTLLLLDEPTSSLDLKNQLEILSLIRDIIRGHGIAGVVTMHDLNMALRYSDKCVFLKDGAICAACKTSEVSADTIKMVYGVPVEIHLLNGNPTVIPLDNP